MEMFSVTVDNMLLVTDISNRNYHYFHLTAFWLTVSSDGRLINLLFGNINLTAGQKKNQLLWEHA